MALRDLSSFDHFATSDLAARGFTTTGGVTISASNGRNSTSSLRCAKSGFVDSAATLGVSGVSGATCIVGMAVKISSIPAATFPILTIRDGSTTHITVAVTSTGTIQVIRGNTTGGTVLGTSVSTISSATYYFIETKVLINDSTGTYEVKVDGVSYVSGTGADTRNGANAGWSGIVLGLFDWFANQTFDVDYDDLYVADGSGGVEDDFLGDHRIVGIVASSGNGTNTDWTPSTGSDRGAVVDEATPNTSDYVLGPSSGLRDTYNFGAVGVSGTVKALQTVRYTRAGAAGIRSVGPAFRIGGVNYDGSGQVLGSDWTYHREIHRVSPATSSAWTISEIDGAEFGQKVTA